MGNPIPVPEISFIRNARSEYSDRPFIQRTLSFGLQVFMV